MHIVRAAVLTSVVAASLSLAACATRLRGEVTYDEHVDFSRFHSYALVPLASGTPAQRALAEREVRAALDAKGLRSTDAGSADLLARVLLDRRHKARVSGSITAPGDAVGMEVSLDERTSGNRVWSSWVAETYSESLKAETEIPKAVKMIFESYPPK